MKNLICMLALVIATPVLVYAEAIPGKPAPNFQVKDATGKVQNLSDYKGKWVVLEWTNKDCPYVKKHYGSNNMQKLQKTYVGKGVNWLSVVTSKTGENLTPADSAAQAVLLDEGGTMGRAYGAKTTPHMYVINPQGSVVYAGGIDDNDSSNPDVISKSKNYVAAALDAGMAGKPIETASARPYGCSVKY